MKEGQGNYAFKNGDSYEGEWKGNIKNGDGDFSYINGDKYQGKWKNDKRDGTGVINYANGDKYDGQWKNNHIHGKGTFTTSAGDKYKGEWKNDMKEEIDSINLDLASAHANDDFIVAGWEDHLIRRWIRSVLRKITHYKALHERYLNMAAALEPGLPNDIVLNNVFPFLAYTLEYEDVD